MLDNLGFQEWIDVGDFTKLAFRLLVDVFFCAVIVSGMYRRIYGSNEFPFTYYAFNVITFTVCFLLRKVPTDLGFALGLFAVFGILRYRTEQIGIKDMTYLFSVITLAVINALVSKKVSIAELVFTDGMILLVTYVLEHLWLTRHEAMKQLIYERIDLVKPGRRQELLDDLNERIGIKVSRVEVGRYDLLRDTVQLRVFYFEDEQDHRSFNELAADDDD